MEKGPLKANSPGAQGSHDAAEAAPCLAGTSCHCGKQPAIPGAEGPGRGLGSSRTVPAPRSTASSSSSSDDPRLSRALLSKASLGGRETPRAWDPPGRGSGEKPAHLRLKEQALSLC